MSDTGNFAAKRLIKCQTNHKHKNAHNLKNYTTSNSTTDLHIYNLDAVPSVYVVWNHVDTDKLTTAKAERLRRAQLDSVANHVKARQSLIERSVT